jgi:hypothetical protein
MEFQQLTTTPLPTGSNWSGNGGYVSALPAYNYHGARIELHDRNQSGDILHRFTNASPVAEVWQVFESVAGHER